MACQHTGYVNVTLDQVQLSLLKLSLCAVEISLTLLLWKVKNSQCSCLSNKELLNSRGLELNQSQKTVCTLFNFSLVMSDICSQCVQMICLDIKWRWKNLSHVHSLSISTALRRRERCCLHSKHADYNKDPQQRVCSSRNEKAGYQSHYYLPLIPKNIIWISWLIVCVFTGWSSWLVTMPLAALFLESFLKPTHCTCRLLLGWR